MHDYAVRWQHVITAIAWIGSSFSFVAPDLGLGRDIPGPADGEEWQVHGRGFYHLRKYMVAPAAMSEHLIWFKWESYAIWLSGATLVMVVHRVGGASCSRSTRPRRTSPSGRGSRSRPSRSRRGGCSTTRCAARGRASWWWRS